MTSQLTFTSKSAHILVEVKQEFKPNCVSIFERLAKRRRLKKRLISGPGSCDSDRLSTRCQLWYPSQFTKQGHLIYIFLFSHLLWGYLSYFPSSPFFLFDGKPRIELTWSQALLQEDSFHWHGGEVTQITTLVVEWIRIEIYWDGERWCFISVKWKRSENLCCVCKVWTFKLLKLWLGKRQTWPLIFFV